MSDDECLVVAEAHRYADIESKALSTPRIHSQTLRSTRRNHVVKRFQTKTKEQHSSKSLRGTKSYNIVADNEDLATANCESTPPDEHIEAGASNHQDHIDNDSDDSEDSHFHEANKLPGCGFPKFTRWVVYMYSDMIKQMPALFREQINLNCLMIPILRYPVHPWSWDCNYYDHDRMRSRVSLNQYTFDIEYSRKSIIVQWTHVTKGDLHTTKEHRCELHIVCESTALFFWNLINLKLQPYSESQKARSFCPDVIELYTSKPLNVQYEEHGPLTEIAYMSALWTQSNVYDRLLIDIQRCKHHCVCSRLLRMDTWSQLGAQTLPLMKKQMN